MTGTTTDTGGSPCLAWNSWHAPDVVGGARVLDLSNDVRMGPVVVVDENGRVVRVIPNR